MSLGCAVLVELNEFHPGLEGCVIDMGNMKPIALKKAIHFHPLAQN